MRLSGIRDILENDVERCINLDYGLNQEYKGQ